MKPVFTAVYKASRLYWDTRFNDIHIPLSYDFARQLLLARPAADEDIVIPAILLHDNGWSLIRLGVVAVVMMLVAPQGIWGRLQQRFGLEVLPIRRLQ